MHHTLTCTCRCLPKPWEQILNPAKSDFKCETKLIAYPYHANKVVRCGDEYTLATAKGPVVPQAGKWYTLTSYVKMNTAGACPQGDSASSCVVLVFEKGRTTETVLNVGTVRAI
jgi:hypothetical protein